MKKNLRLLVGAALGAAASLAFTSCAYDPYYGSTSVGASYSSGGGGGYGDGYGYGGSSFSTSIFVGTGNPRWGYDPYCYSYYDYSRHCYYDPYLNGYYPVGYRPVAVYGVPHPYGWRPGNGYCPPPRNVTNVTVVNYRNRESAYRNTNYGWAKQVRQAPYSGRAQGQRPNTQPQGYSNGSRPQSSGASRGSYQNQTKSQYNQGSRSSTQSGSRQGQQSRYSSAVNTYSQPQHRTQSQGNQGQRPQLGNPGNNRNQPQGNNGKRQNKSQKQAEQDAQGTRGYR